MRRRLDWDRLVDLDLPDLEPAPPGSLTDGDRLDGVLVDGATGDVRAARVRLDDCAVRGAVLGDVVLRRVWAGTVLVEDLAAQSLDLADGALSDIVVDRGRAGALLLTGATLERVTVRGARLDYVNARGATLERVQLLDCRIGELDLGLATATDVRLVGCELERLVLTGATCTRVDLSGARLAEVEGVAGLAGTTLSTAQVTALAPALAAHLGVEVAP